MTTTMMLMMIHLLWEPVEGRALLRLDHVTKLTSRPRRRRLRGPRAAPDGAGTPFRRRTPNATCIGSDTDAGSGKWSSVGLPAPERIQSDYSLRDSPSPQIYLKLPPQSNASLNRAKINTTAPATARSINNNPAGSESCCTLTNCLRVCAILTKAVRHY